MPTPPVPKLSSSAKRRQATAASGGGAGLGLVALIAGLVLHGHYAPIKRICDSGLGALGQAFDQGAQQHCSLDSVLAEVGTVATVIGAIILAGTLLTAIGLLLEARLEAGKPTTPTPPPRAASQVVQTRTESSTSAQRKD